MLSLRLALCLCVFAFPVGAEVLAKALPGAQMRGQATYRHLGFQLYDARLFTKGGAPLNGAQDYALELIYKRTLSQNALVEGTLREMKRIGKDLPPRAQLEACFQNVNTGDRYLAVSRGPDQLSFWRNDRQTCTLKQKDIKTGFMSVFLSDQSRAPRFTQKLLGQ